MGLAAQIRGKYKFMTPIFDINIISTWPTHAVEHLTKNYDLYLGWETDTNPPSGLDYDAAVNELVDILRASDYTILGYHCTRLTDVEVHNVFDEGMYLPNLDKLCKRISDIESAGLINSVVAQELRTQNQAHLKCRAEKIWFCFFPPRIVDEFGISRFFRFWGGEALYSMHESNGLIATTLSGIGTPCIVEAYVPIANLPKYLFERKLIRRFLISRGLLTREPIEHEDYSFKPIPARNISRIIRYPENAFLQLTGCNHWSKSLL